MKLSDAQQDALCKAFDNEGVVSAGRKRTGGKLATALNTLRSLERKGLVKFLGTFDHSQFSFLSLDEHRFTLTDAGREAAKDLS
jgi:hypothetical protein